VNCRRPWDEAFPRIGRLLLRRWREKRRLGAQQGAQECSFRPMDATTPSQAYGRHCRFRPSQASPALLQPSRLRSIPMPHRGLQRTCSASPSFPGCTDALRHPPSPTPRPRPPRRQPAIHAARRQPTAVAASSRVSRPPRPRTSAAAATARTATNPRRRSHGKNRTRTRTNTIPYGTEASAAG